MSTEHILVEQSDSILSIRMNRPDKKNALTSAMYTAFSDALEKAESDKSVRVIFITGTPECFSGGNASMTS